MSDKIYIVDGSNDFTGEREVFACSPDSDTAKKLRDKLREFSTVSDVRCWPIPVDTLMTDDLVMLDSNFSRREFL